MVIHSTLGRLLSGAALLFALVDRQSAAWGDTAGGFGANIGAQYAYDDNLYRLPSQFDTAAVSSGISRQDHINTLSAGATGRLSFGHQALGADLRLADNRFAHNADLNNTSGSGRVTWNWLGSPYLAGDAGVNFTRSLAGFADNRFFAKDLIDTTEYFASANLRITSRWKVTAALREAATTHSADARQVDDFHTRSGNTGIEYLLTEQNSVGVDYRYIDASFPRPASFAGAPFDRDYRDSVERVLIKYALSGKSVLDANVGYLKRHYVNSDFGSFSGDIWRVSLQWQVSGKTQVLLSGWRELTAYLDSQSDYFVAKGGSIAPSWNPTERISLSVTAAWIRQDYLSSSPSALLFASRLDRIRSGQAALTYTPREALTLGLSYRYEQRDSNRLQFAYVDRLASGSITIRF